MLDYLGRFKAAQLTGCLDLAGLRLRSLQAALPPRTRMALRMRAREDTQACRPLRLSADAKGECLQQRLPGRSVEGISCNYAVRQLSGSAAP